jgi:hypothetical protein
VILDGLGGLYLAYKLLGGKNGPLRTIDYFYDLRVDLEEAVAKI